MKNFSTKQIQLMRLALGLSGLPVNDSSAETVLIVHSEMERLGNKFSLKEAANIEYHIYRKYFAPKIISKEKIKKKL